MAILRVLVTGAAGLLGGRVVALLAPRFDVVAARFPEFLRLAFCVRLQRQQYVCFSEIIRHCHRDAEYCDCTFQSLATDSVGIDP